MTFLVIVLLVEIIAVLFKGFSEIVETLEDIEKKI